MKIQSSPILSRLNLVVRVRRTLKSIILINFKYYRVVADSMTEDGTLITYFYEIPLLERKRFFGLVCYYNPASRIPTELPKSANETRTILSTSPSIWGS